MFGKNFCYLRTYETCLKEYTCSATVSVILILMNTQELMIEFFLRALSSFMMKVGFLMSVDFPPTNFEMYWNSFLCVSETQSITFQTFRRRSNISQQSEYHSFSEAAECKQKLGIKTFSSETRHYNCKTIIHRSLHM